VLIKFIRDKELNMGGYTHWKTSHTHFRLYYLTDTEFRGSTIWLVSYQGWFLRAWGEAPGPFAPPRSIIVAIPSMVLY
jgi:hypothetical protein